MILTNVIVVVCLPVTHSPLQQITVTVETPIKSSPNPSSAGAEVNPNPAGGVEDIPSPIRLDSVDKVRVCVGGNGVYVL